MLAIVSDKADVLLVEETMRERAMDGPHVIVAEWSVLGAASPQNQFSIRFCPVQTFFPSPE
jgi:hypothetical protein